MQAQQFDRTAKSGRSTESGKPSPTPAAPRESDSLRDPVASPKSDILLDVLVQTSYTVIGIVSTVAARHDLSLTLLRVGGILRDRTLTLSELADYLGLDRSTITGLIDRATRRGILTRVENEQDRRSRRVTLTAAGQRLAEVCADEIADGIAPLAARLPATDRSRLSELLAALIDAR